MSSIGYLKWYEVMKSEINFMYENKVWTLVESPEGIRPIRCKYVFKRKTIMDGNIVTKSKVSGKRLQKRKEIDFEETISPVTMLIRILLTIIAYYNCLL